MLSQRQKRAPRGLCREKGSSASRRDVLLFPETRHGDILEMPIISSLLPDSFLKIPPNPQPQM